MKNPRTFILFLISFAIIILTFLSVPLWIKIGMGANKVPQGFSILFGFGFGIAGMITGIIDFNKNKSKKYWIGFIGNLIIFILFILMIIKLFIL